MKLSNHAKNKLEIYGIQGDEVIKACSKPCHEFYDTNEDAHIKIIELKDLLFAAVYNRETQKIITVYRTEQRTIRNRQKNRRWL